jgi:hypothetical protein
MVKSHAIRLGNLTEDIYMRTPEGYPISNDSHTYDGRPRGIGKSNTCVKLRKSIYGLKQSPREWYARLTTFLISLGFVISTFDPCVLSHKSRQLIMAIYVDDITIFGPQTSILKN